MVHSTLPGGHFMGPILLVASWISANNAVIALIPSIAATMYYLLATYVIWKNRNK